MTSIKESANTTDVEERLQKLEAGLATSVETHLINTVSQRLNAISDSLTKQDYVLAVARLLLSVSGPVVPLGALLWLTTATPVEGSVGYYAAHATLCWAIAAIALQILKKVLNIYDAYRLNSKYEGIALQMARRLNIASPPDKWESFMRAINDAK